MEDESEKKMRDKRPVRKANLKYEATQLLPKYLVISAFFFSLVHKK